MSDLPDSLSNGEKARLIPVVAETSKEVRAVSIVLAAMTAVKASNFIIGLGQAL